MACFPASRPAPSRRCILALAVAAGVMVDMASAGAQTAGGSGAAAASGSGQGVWSSGGQSSVWQSTSSSAFPSGSGGGGVWQTTSSVWGSGGGAQVKPAARPQSAAASRVAQAAAALDDDGEVIHGTPGYFDQFGLAHNGEVTVDGHTLIVPPTPPRDAAANNFGVDIPPPPRAADSGAAVGSPEAGAFVKTPQAAADDAALKVMAKLSAMSAASATTGDGQ